MLNHILIDVLDPTGEIQQKVESALREACNILYSNTTLRILVLHCRETLVYIHRIENSLLVDLLGREEVVDLLVSSLPIQNTVIRLVERGFPEKGRVL